MTTIRKQSIISSGVVYIGLAMGAAWQYIIAKEFRPDQYGLINGMFIAIGTVLSYLAGFGMPAMRCCPPLPGPASMPSPARAWR